MKMILTISFFLCFASCIVDSAVFVKDGESSSSTPLQCPAVIQAKNFEIYADTSDSSTCTCHFSMPIDCLQGTQTILTKTEISYGPCYVHNNCRKNAIYQPQDACFKNIVYWDRLEFAISADKLANITAFLNEGSFPGGVLKQFQFKSGNKLPRPYIVSFQSDDVMNLRCKATTTREKDEMELDSSRSNEDSSSRSNESNSGEELEDENGSMITIILAALPASLILLGSVMIVVCCYRKKRNHNADDAEKTQPQSQKSVEIEWSDIGSELSLDLKNPQVGNSTPVHSAQSVEVVNATAVDLSEYCEVADVVAIKMISEAIEAGHINKNSNFHGVELPKEVGACNDGGEKDTVIQVYSQDSTNKHTGVYDNNLELDYKSGSETVDIDEPVYAVVNKTRPAKESSGTE